MHSTGSALSGRLQLGRHPFILLAICRPNARFTTALPDLRRYLIAPGERISRVEYLEVQGMPAAIFRRTGFSSGRKVERMELYFATRDFVYRFSLLPEAESDLPWTDPAGSYLKELALSLKFSGPVFRPISEAAFEKRLRIALALLAFLALVLFAILYRSFRRKKKSVAQEGTLSPQTDTIVKSNEKI
ncbi:MAG: hypothetical protein HS115_17610 [Spirochaetales bacterium]|nr:hypothetical protein [Spirochaetales bacterium]